MSTSRLYVAILAGAVARTSYGAGAYPLATLRANTAWLMLRYRVR